MTTVCRMRIACPGTAALVAALLGGLGGCTPPAAPPSTAAAPTAPAETGPAGTGPAAADAAATDPAATGPAATDAATSGPAASGPAATDPAASGPAASPAEARADRALPAGAIAVGPDLYQVPIGTDAEGCRMYRLHSPGRMVTQAIAWRRPDGSFTLDRREADCAR
jgi:hypothetical protein